MLLKVIFSVHDIEASTAENLVANQALTLNGKPEPEGTNLASFLARSGFEGLGKILYWQSKRDCVFFF